MNPRLWTPEIVRPMPVVDGALRRLRQKEYERWRKVRDPRIEQQCAIAQVEMQTAAAGSGTSAVITLGTNTTAGELIVAATLVWFDGVDATISDDVNGSAYVKIWNKGIGGHQVLTLWYVKNSAANVTTITVDCGASKVGGVIAAHYTGVDTVSPLDLSGGSPALSSGSPWTSASISPGSSELLIGAVLGIFNTVNPDFTASGSWKAYDGAAGNGLKSLDYAHLSGNNGGAMAMTYQIGSGSTANTGTNPSSTVDNYPGIASFKAASGGAARGLFMTPPVSGVGVGGSFFRDPLQEKAI